MLVATLKDMTEQPGASLKKVGMAERNARMEKLKLQLKGVAISSLSRLTASWMQPCNSARTLYMFVPDMVPRHTPWHLVADCRCKASRPANSS